MQIDKKTIDDLKAVQDAARAAVQQASGAGGLKRAMTAGILRLDRFVAGNIEVDTGRTKNSIVPSITGAGAQVTGQLGSGVRYSPYVRNRNGGLQFFEYARRTEVPKVLQMMAVDISAKIEGEFE